MKRWSHRLWSQRRRALVSIGLGLALGVSPAAAYDGSGLLEIHVINVQQGASTLVIGPNGTTILMDAGGDGKGRGEVVPYLEEIGLTAGDGLDYTIASHLHADHIGGFDEVLGAGYDVREANWYNAEVELPLPDTAPTTVENYFAAAALTSARGPTPIPLGHSLELGDGATFTVVATGGEVAGHGFVTGADRNENDLSVAVVIQHGAFDFVWAGDLGGGADDRPCTGRSTGQVNVETPLARALTGGARPLLAGAVEVLHVNHHGSQSSTNSDWMNLLRPRVAVISVDAHKGFGHPHAVVVDNVLLGRAPCVEAPPALVLQTDEGHPEGAGTSFSGHVVGDVRITTDGGSSFRVEAGGDVRHGTAEREAAGLPKELCMPSDTALCLNQSRFRVTVDWQTPRGDSGKGMAVPLTPDTGYFWFFDRDNVEIVLKVLDACVEPHNRFWVFAGGLTNVRAEITVTDTETGEVRTYLNPLRTRFQPIQDTLAFECAAIPPPPPPPPPPQDGVILSEVFYNAEGNDDHLEWVELYNAGSSAVDLSGYSLGNGGPDYTYSKVQLSGTIAAGSTFVVGGPVSGSANGFPSYDLVVDFEPNFQNSDGQGDGVALFDRPAAQVSSSTVPIDAVVYGPNNAGGLIDETGEPNDPEVGNAPAGSSIERLDLDGAWHIRSSPSPNDASHLE